MNRIWHRFHGPNRTLELLLSVCCGADALHSPTSDSFLGKVPSVNFTLGKRLRAGSADLLAVTSTFYAVRFGPDVLEWNAFLPMWKCAIDNAAKIHVTYYLYLIFQTTKPTRFKSNWRVFWVFSAEVENSKKKPRKWSTPLTLPKKLYGICLSLWWKLNWQVNKGFSSSQQCPSEVKLKNRLKWSQTGTIHFLLEIEKCSITCSMNMLTGAFAGWWVFVGVFFSWKPGLSMLIFKYY